LRETKSKTEKKQIEKRLNMIIPTEKEIEENEDNPEYVEELRKAAETCEKLLSYKEEKKKYNGNTFRRRRGKLPKRFIR